MSNLKEIQEDVTRHEQQLVVARQKLKDAEKAVEMDPDDVNKNTLQVRRQAVSALEDKLADFKRQLADLVSHQKMAEKPADPTGIEPDDHLKERSTLRYGNVLDVNAIDIEEPSGQTADWLTIGIYVIGFALPIILKALYMLSTRGRQTVKENKGTRIRFKDDSSFEDVNGIRRPKHLYVSMPTAQSTMKAEELTPGRFRTIVCGLFPAQIQVRNIISPVMGVIGFAFFVKEWPERIKAFLNKSCPFIKPEVRAGAPASEVEFLSRNQIYFMRRQEVLDKNHIPDIERLIEYASSGDPTAPDSIESPYAPWVFSCAPDRCPPTCIYLAGVAELGAFFSILQDMRNTIMASKTVGTAEEKMKKKSSFYQSYLRRTQSMGIQLDQRIILLYMIEWGKEMIDHFHLGDDMDPELRALAQALIDQKVKEISNQEPLKI
uniref:Nucleoprotein n=1 Tax=Rusne orthohantavirus TaxID=2771208 RepID=A0A7H0TIA5_9VIRU|nr:nucleocapsid protein [Rusne orthohantavirus]QNR00534.1 nucleocapsid protein [Rusne orthohantavirus]QNR00535.1 nucleocapsid protein [Rusne orthohantavirus]QNR00536.1 nucleocapsid protein [Rusne orthohantavirus]QNR00537.1 nucleocapsid protein [Rusne orthohantavirus]